jgi:hypothetical protein
MFFRVIIVEYSRQHRSAASVVDEDRSFAFLHHLPLQGREHAADRAHDSGLKPETLAQYRQPAEAVAAIDHDYGLVFAKIRRFNSCIGKPHCRSQQRPWRSCCLFKKQYHLSTVSVAT